MATTWNTTANDITWTAVDDPSVTWTVQLNPTVTSGAAVHNDLSGRSTADAHPATAVSVDASGFDGNLTTGDDTVQKVAQKLDDLTVGGGGGWDVYSETTLGAASSAVELTIPTFTAVRIVATLQTTHASNVETYAQVNADTTASNYRHVQPPINSSFATWTTPSLGGFAFGPVGAAATVQQSQLILEFDQRLSGKYLFARSTLLTEWQYVDRQSWAQRWHQWRNTSDALTLLTFIPATATIAAGSYFRVEVLT